MSQQTFKIYLKNATEKKIAKIFAHERRKKLAIKAEQWESEAEKPEDGAIFNKIP